MRTNYIDILRLTMSFFLGVVFSFVHSNGCNKIYKSNDFGYIVLNTQETQFNIYKYSDTLKNNISKIACGQILKKKNDYLILSSLYPSLELLKNIKIKSQHNETSDSLIIEVTIPNKIRNSYLMYCETYNNCSLAQQLSKDHRNIIFKLSEDIDLRDYLHLYIVPQINPFREHSSCGDSQTINFVDLPISNLLDDLILKDAKYIKIEILNFYDDLFNQWVIPSEFVLIKDKKLYWRNFIFDLCDDTSKDSFYNQVVETN